MTWEKHVLKDMIQKSGEHIVVYATTGGGKTNLLIDLVLTMQSRNNEKILWYDMGKEEEMLNLLQFSDLKIFYPEGTGVEIEGDFNHNFELQAFNDINEVLDNISKTSINVISVTPFILKPAMFTAWWSDFFTHFLRKAFEKKLPRPLTVCIDQFNHIVPGMGETFDAQQGVLANEIAFNISNLRATKTRMLVSSHKIGGGIRKNIRTQFMWIIFKRLSERIDTDIPRLKMTQGIVQKLKPDQMVIIDPSREYTEPISNIPFRLVEGEEKRERGWNVSYTISQPEILEKSLGLNRDKGKRTKQYKEIASKYMNYLVDELGMDKKEVSEIGGMHPRSIYDF